ncbi:hypothetical protein [Cytobacillus oceanisediminis]|uniref:hypothetical protein n=1 Tax=Cytobacillus oceanisediminis TaxID=665099 RepID=UPI001FB29ABB|nr:hypothetical protein [Cytobacillus oceanisediminis]UOE58065.1 hypothetical protein IRB79_27770 [Cytobacillus oceanisediminis]
MALDNFVRTVHEIDQHWEGKHMNCTYWIGRKMSGGFTIFGADETGVITIEKRGHFDTYRSAREYLKENFRFKGRMVLVK